MVEVADPMAAFDGVGQRLGGVAEQCQAGGGAAGGVQRRAQSRGVQVSPPIDVDGGESFDQASLPGHVAVDERRPVAQWGLAPVVIGPVSPAPFEKFVAVQARHCGQFRERGVG
jgi:hypothetical protein